MLRLGCVAKVRLLSLGETVRAQRSNTRGQTVKFVLPNGCTERINVCRVEQDYKDRFRNRADEACRDGVVKWISRRLLFRAKTGKRCRNNDHVMDSPSLGGLV